MKTIKIHSRAATAKAAIIPANCKSSIPKTGRLRSLFARVTPVLCRIGFRLIVNLSTRAERLPGSAAEQRHSRHGGLLERENG